MYFTVADLLLANAVRRPDAPAVIDGGDTVSFKQLAKWAKRCAGYLAARSNTGDRVAILLPRTGETLAVYFGAQLTGLVPVFLHEQLRPRQIAHIVGHSQAQLVVTSSRLSPLLSECGLQPGQLVEVAGIHGPIVTATPRVIGRDLAGLAYTSGSTGAAKGVMLSHDNLIAGALIVAEYLALSAQDRTLALLPWSFDYGLNQVLATFAAGGAVAMQRSSFPPAVCRTLQAANVTGMAGVPTVWTAMTGPQSPFPQQRYPHLRYLTNSGGALPRPAIQAIRSAHPNTAIYAMYGLTEAFRSTFLNPALIDAKPTSVGRPVPNSDVLIVDDYGRPCAPGEEGQLVHRGPTVAVGYWRDQQATTKVFRPHPFPAYASGSTETVVYTGDYGYADPEGELHYTGRRDLMFKSRGIRTNPTEIEAEVMASGMIAAVVATPIHAADTDPAIYLAVQLRDPGTSLAAVETFCRTELPVHMRPKHIVIVTSLPETPHGKVDRIQVREQMTFLHAAGTQA